MPIRDFIIYWIIWNLYWSIPYSFLWQHFYRQKKEWAVSLSMVVLFFIFQMVVPLMFFGHFFKIENFSPLALVGSFFVLCIPAMVCNKLISKLSAVKFAVSLFYLLVAMFVILSWLYLWSSYLNEMIVDPIQKLCSLSFWGVVVPIISCVFIRFFLKTEKMDAEGGSGSEESNP